MRLWHSKLIYVLDNRRLCDLHMSCCNLRGKGWGKKNVAINYLYDDHLGEEALVVYHHLVLAEMESRGMKPDEKWWDINYCGKNRPPRVYDEHKYELAFKRVVPLLGHTLDILKNDVKALQERGVPVVLTHKLYEDKNAVVYAIYTVGNDKVKVNYSIKL